MSNPSWLITPTSARGLWLALFLLIVGCGARVTLEEEGLGGSPGEGGASAAPQVGGGGGLAAGGAGGAEELPGSLAVGSGHSCSLEAGGELWCWGDNGLGQLADGSTESRSLPERVTSLPASVREVSTLALHACAVLVDGTVWCWGKNDYGHTGTGTVSTFEPWPLEVEALGTDVVSVAAGGQHTCALLLDGSVWCWGWNGAGQLGDGTLIDSSSPIRVESLGNDVAQISVSGAHSCALTTAGEVWCWGWNYEGEVGDGTWEPVRSLPVRVVGLEGVTRIECGAWHSCALREDGSLWCWGHNSLGSLGDGTTLHRNVPVPVTGLDEAVATFAMGAGHSCATGASSFWCWGWNLRGQVGDGTLADRHSPVLIGMPPVSEVELGYWHSCARTVDGAVWCWGNNEDGQLGDGTNESRSSPAPTLAPAR